MLAPNLLAQALLQGAKSPVSPAVAGGNPNALAAALMGNQPQPIQAGFEGAATKRRRSRGLVPPRSASPPQRDVATKMSAPPEFGPTVPDVKEDPAKALSTPYQPASGEPGGPDPLRTGTSLMPLGPGGQPVEVDNRVDRGHGQFVAGYPIAAPAEGQRAFANSAAQDAPRISNAFDQLNVPEGRPKGMPPMTGQAMPAPQGAGLYRNDIPYDGRSAAVRYNNPAAAWPSKRAVDFGAQGYGVLKDGQNNKIARFDDPAHGAAYNMDLLARKYRGMRIEDAVRKWRGGNPGSGSIPKGYSRDSVITGDMLNDRMFMTDFFNKMAGHEGRKGGAPLTSDTLNTAFDIYQAGGLGREAVIGADVVLAAANRANATNRVSEPSGRALAYAPETTIPKERPMTGAKTTDPLVAVLLGSSKGKKARHKPNALAEALLKGSPAMPAPDAASRRLPIPQPQRELAESAPIVSAVEGGRINPVSFTTGGAPSQNSIDQRRDLAQALMRGGNEPIRHPLQGASQLARTLVGGVGMMKANADDKRRSSMLADALMGRAGGPDLQALAEVDPMMAYEIQSQQQQTAQADALRREQWARQDEIRQQEWAREDAQRAEDRQFTLEDREQWIDETLPDGSLVQRSSQTGQVRMPGGRGVTVNNDLGDKDYKIIEDRYSQFGAAPDELAMLNESRAALNASGGTITGIGASQLRLPMAKIANYLGVDNADTIENTEVLGSSMANRVLSMTEQMAGVLTDRDIEFLKQAAGGDINLNRGSMLRVMNHAETMLRARTERWNTMLDQMAEQDPGISQRMPMWRVQLPPRQSPIAEEMIQAPPNADPRDVEDAVEALKTLGNSQSAAERINQRLREKYGISPTANGMSVR